MTDRDLLNKLHERPYQPFRVKLSNNTTLDVLDPTTVIVGPASAIMPVEAVLGDHGYCVIPLAYGRALRRGRIYRHRTAEVAVEAEAGVVNADGPR